MAQMVDEVDYGMLLLNDDGRVAHFNRAARRDLDEQHPLQLHGGELRARLPQDTLALRDALAGASQRGLRRLLRLGEGSERTTVAVVPLPPLPGQARHGVVLVLAKRQVCEELTVDWFARAHSLTMAETAVVKGLCADLTPQEIAKRQGVGLATIRTQIGSIRAKTGSASIRALVRQVAMLPPLVSALQGLGGSAPAPEARPLRQPQRA
ncbi:MAG: helix-turn-helix transcriptional regulator [Burkholderiales bacterium]|nr:helix-turn-helix transcriptional regulator [Burkholderiales bacterium]